MPFKNAKQPSYVLYLNQSLTDIERFRSNKSAPSSYRSILAIDTTFSIYWSALCYPNDLSESTQRRVDITLVSWTSSYSPASREKRFFILVASSQKGNRLSKDLAIIGTDECRELLDKKNLNNFHSRPDKQNESLMIFLVIHSFEKRKDRYKVNLRRSLIIVTKNLKTSGTKSKRTIQ